MTLAPATAQAVTTLLVESTTRLAEALMPIEALRSQMAFRPGAHVDPLNAKVMSAQHLAWLALDLMREVYRHRTELWNSIDRTDDVRVALLAASVEAQLGEEWKKDEEPRVRPTFWD